MSAPYTQLLYTGQESVYSRLRTRSLYEYFLRKRETFYFISRFVISQNLQIIIAIKKGR